MAYELPAIEEYWSLTQIADFCGINRETARARLSGLSPKLGPGTTKLYLARRAVPVALGYKVGAEVSASDAQVELTIKKSEQIDQEMEIIARKHAPIDLTESFLEILFTAIGEIVKLRIGKILTKDDLEEMKAEMRAIPDKLEEWTKSAKASLPERNSLPPCDEPSTEA